MGHLPARLSSRPPAGPEHRLEEGGNLTAGEQYPPSRVHETTSLGKTDSRPLAGLDAAERGSG
ncbi:hypothetical protein GCM10010353_45580 [Streptomyces chryseus]|uniref:Uncharacterized protein n=1 Tax=Streptomyces chryseus TaxID=68186 RepID=A0ABQ3DLV0_9ACTN|nr:hypothetical protein GCM10010353_45580 [Streptomyces chryseus]GHB05201.1 hypothetical protein GCM10010346_30250 [Streptomyces chryseus]